MRYMIRELVTALILLWLLSSTCFAEGYKWTDEEGTFHFSDMPRPISTTLPPQKYSNEQERGRLGKNIVIYADKSLYAPDEYKIIKVTLVSESKDYLLFDIEYYFAEELTDTSLNSYLGLNVYPSNVKEDTYVATPFVMPASGKNKISYKLSMSKYSQDSLMTDILKLYMRNSRKKIVVERVIPFEKQWRK